MTARELSQLRLLPREIEQDRRRLCELEALATGRVSRICELPFRRDAGDQVGEYAVEIAQLREEIGRKMRRCLAEQHRLLRYLEEVDDSLIRQILTLRYARGFSWRRVALVVGGGNTEDSVRKAHDRFLKRMG